jgi:serine/threonine protein kinase/tetratricopeptide (TPR) repeat protein
MRTTKPRVSMHYARKAYFVCFGPFKLDLKAGELYKEGGKILLQEQPFRVLRMLVENGGEVVTREEIRRTLWPNDTVVEFDHSINAAIKKLRLALGDSAEKPCYIGTVARRGYRLLTPVEWLEAQPTESPSTEVRAVQPPATTQENLIGKRVSHYRVLGVLGGGGMGVVYRAEDLKLGRGVALKFLPDELVHDPVVLGRFEREARAASALNHPHICTIYEFEEYEGQPFIVMELLDGQTLRERIGNASAPLQTNELIELAIQITDGLDAAHQKGIIHRDIKTANIFLTNRGEAKILDFGLSRIVDLDEHPHNPLGEEVDETSAPREAASILSSNSTLTQTGAMLGTVSYMSPEQVRGEKLDTRTDLFSFGMVLYEMATGRRAFAGDTAPLLREAIVNHTPTRVRELNTRIPPKMEGIINKCLEKDRHLRYQHASEIRADLQRLKRDTELDKVTSTAETARSRRTMMIVAISAFVLVALIAGGWSYLARTRTRIDSIAVLPFVNTSGDPTVEYLSDGITEGVIHNLSQLPQLRVMARTTVFYYKGRGIDPQKVGRDLNVQAVLTGTVVQRGSTLNVETELVDVSNGTEMWGEKYDRRLSDAYIIEEQITEDISEKLKIRLSRDEKQRLIKPATQSPEAYEFYLKGRYYWNKRTEDGLNKARDYFNQAISVDPKYALAYAGLADDYLIQGEDGFALPVDAFSRAKAAALKAIEGDDKLAEAHTSLADVKAVYDWDWSGAEKEFRRAIELNPNYGTAHQWYAEDVLMRLGRFEEAVAEIKRAKAVDPLSLIINSVECEVLAFAGDYDNAIKQGHKTIELDPNFPDGHFELGRAYEYKGMYNEAIREFQKAEPLRPAGEPELVGHAYAKMGDRAATFAALGGLEELEKVQGGTSFGQALIYTALGDRDHAFGHLQQAYEQHNYWITTIKTDPRFDDLRPDPRFAVLLHRMGLPE